MLGVVSVGACAVLAQGCSAGGGDEADEVRQPVASGTTLADCRRLLPDAVVESLGWSDVGQPDLTADRCARSGPDGMVQVHRVPVTSDARQTFEARCAALDPEPGEPVDWLGDQPACATDPAGAPYSYLVTLVDDEVVEVFVAPTRPTSEQQVVRGLTALARGLGD